MPERWSVRLAGKAWLVRRGEETIAAFYDQTRALRYAHREAVLDGLGILEVTA